MSTETVEHIHRHISNNGNVSIEIEKNTKGYNWTIRIDRPVPEHESAFGVGCKLVQNIAAIEQELKAQLIAMTQEPKNEYPIKAEG